MTGTPEPVTVQNNVFDENEGYAITLWSPVEGPSPLEFVGNQGSNNGATGILVDARLSNTTMGANPNLPYIIQTITVPAGKTLTLGPGVVFKGSQSHSGGGSLISVEGVLQVEGAANELVYLTSLHDDTVGGDVLRDGPTVQPGAGDWRGIDVQPGGRVDMVYAVLRYAGSDSIGLLNLGGQVTLDYVQLLHNQGNGVANQQGGVLAVTHSLVAYNTGSGVTNSADGTLTVTYNDIVGNQGYGVYSSQPAGQYTPAQHNYWGSPDGPTWDGNYCSNPPQGSGELVTCHNVLWEPFVSVPYFP